MAKLTFFSVLKSNLKCAFCKLKNCPIRYMPENKKNDYDNGTRYVTSCKKDTNAREASIRKKPLTWKS